MCIWHLEQQPKPSETVMHNIKSIQTSVPSLSLSLWCAIKCKNIYWQCDIGSAVQLKRKTITKITTKLFSFFSQMFILTSLWIYIYPEQGIWINIWTSKSQHKFIFIRIRTHVDESNRIISIYLKLIVYFCHCLKLALHRNDLSQAFWCLVYGYIMSLDAAWPFVWVPHEHFQSSCILHVEIDKPIMGNGNTERMRMRMWNTKWWYMNRSISHGDAITLGHTEENDVQRYKRKKNILTLMAKCIADIDQTILHGWWKKKSIRKKPETADRAPCQGGEWEREIKRKRRRKKRRKKTTEAKEEKSKESRTKFNFRNRSMRGNQNIMAKIVPCSR